MGYYSAVELQSIGFKQLGSNVKVSTKAAIYNPELIEIGDNSRIDDFVSLSGRVSLGKNVHLAIASNLAGGSLGISIEDFSGLSYGVQVFTRIDDYSGLTLSNPTVENDFRITHEKSILIRRHCKIGTYSVVLPGSDLGVGCSFSAQSLIKGKTEEHYLYGGNPLTKIAPLSRKLLQVELEYITWKSEQ
jgi:acetyltransferase-like isoleucine patch superfamily enzyme